MRGRRVCTAGLELISAGERTVTETLTDRNPATRGRIRNYKYVIYTKILDRPECALCRNAAILVGAYSIRILACLTTGAQRARSARICAAYSSGVLPTGSMPSTE